MNIGPDQIVACPICNGLAKYMTLLSGNTFGAILRSDGKQLAPMMPWMPPMVKCRHCGHCYWLAEAEHVGWEGDDDQPQHPDASSLQEVQEPTEEDYYEALEGDLATERKQERSLRILAWWRSNDAFRGPKTTKNASLENGLREKNLDALSQLLDEDTDQDHLMRAEVLRELGEFESAKEILARVESSEFAAVVRQMRSLCESRDASVTLLRFED
jgi:hypothetical protein